MAGGDEVSGGEAEILGVGVRQADQAALTALHEFVRLALRRDEHRLLLLDNAQHRRALEAGTVEDHHGVVVFGGLQARSVALGLCRRAKQRDLDRVEFEHAAADTAALGVDVLGEDPEHLVHVTHGDTKADGDCVLELGLDVSDRDGVGRDTGVGVDPVGCVTGVGAEGVDLGERVVASVEGLLEVNEDSTAGIVVEVGERLVGFGGWLVGVVASRGVIAASAVVTVIGSVGRVISG